MQRRRTYQWDGVQSQRTWRLWGRVCPFFVCGLTGDDFGSLTPEQIEVYKKAFGKAEILIGTQGNEPITMKVQAKSKSTPGQERGPSKPTPGQDR